jgi:hypothetical protein
LDEHPGPPSEVQDLHRYKPDPWDGSRTPQEGSGLLTVGSQDSKTKNTQALIKAGRGSGADTVRIVTCTLLFPAQAETRCCHVAYCP